jgi:hypothetical protein
MRVVLGLGLSLLAAGEACAQDFDAAALALPGAAPQEPAQRARAWQLFVEGAAGQARLRTPTLDTEGRSTQRVSVDLQLDATLPGGLRAVLADRLDADWQQGFEQRHEVNTLKEAYLSWQPRNELIVDAGRVNQYSGVAIGYNPTDFFRDGALRSLVSVDPTSIKKNRQGSVMLRGQALWERASLTALVSPKLAGEPSAAAYHPDWGATNGRHRALLIFSHYLGEELNPQWLLYQDESASPQLGLNLTKLVNDATVAYAEWSGGRSRTLLDQARGPGGDKAFRNRVSTGLTYTTSDKLALTLEYEYNGTGLSKSQWQSLPAASLPVYLGYRNFAQTAQEMVSRHAVFMYATWQDVLVNHLDLTAMIRRNNDDHSRLSWVELRYRWSRDEIAWQWQKNTGSLFSDYGASPQRRAWQLSYRHYF